MLNHGHFAKQSEKPGPGRDLGLAIAYYRKRSGMTQAQLAGAVGVSRAHISAIEAPNMPTPLSLETLFDISDALGVEPGELFAFQPQPE